MGLRLLLLCLRGGLSFQPMFTERLLCGRRSVAFISFSKVFADEKMFFHLSISCSQRQFLI